MSDDQDTIAAGVELAYQVVVWAVFNGPGNLKAGEVRQHIRALFGSEVDAGLAERRQRANEL